MTIGTPQSLGTNSLQGNNSSITLTTTNAILAGDLVVVVVALNDTSSPTVSSVSDGTNSYTLAKDSGYQGNTDISIWYKQNAAAVGSGATITATYSAGLGGVSDGAGILAARVTGVVLTSSLDQTQSALAASASTVTATTGTLAQAIEIAFGGAVCAGGTFTYSGASGFTNISDISAIAGGNGNAALDYNIVNSTSAISYSPTFNAAGRICAVVATFKGLQFPVFAFDSCQSVTTRIVRAVAY